MLRYWAGCADLEGEAIQARPITCFVSVVLGLTLTGWLGWAGLGWAVVV